MELHPPKKPNSWNTSKRRLKFKKIPKIARAIETRWINQIDHKKAILILGPRQVGKTTLVQKGKIASLSWLLWHHLFLAKQGQAAVDYLEVTDGKFYAYEFKWNPAKKYKFLQNFFGYV